VSFVPFVVKTSVPAPICWYREKASQLAAIQPDSRIERGGLCGSAPLRLRAIIFSQAVFRMVAASLRNRSAFRSFFAVENRRSLFRFVSL
jgi:hypothetical protein